MTDFCQVPCLKPAIDHYYNCSCVDPDADVDYLKRPFDPPRRSMPFIPGSPVRMGQHTITSDPVWAYPVSLDRLIAAALATRRAVYQRKLIRPVLERSETPTARKVAEIFHLQGGALDTTLLEDEIRKQLDLIHAGEVKTLRSWSVNPGTQVATKEKADKGDAWTKGKRQGPYDIRTFREIHMLWHAAYHDAPKPWLIVRRDQNYFDNFEENFHLTWCSQPPETSAESDMLVPMESLRLGARQGCRSFDLDYWDELGKAWELSLIHTAGLSSNPSSNDSQEPGYLGHLAGVYAKWVADLRAQEAVEIEAWEERLIGMNATSRWLQRNVIKVLEEASRGVKITIMNPAVLHRDKMKNIKPRNFMPMAWIHLDTEWKTTPNAPYAGDPKSRRDGDLVDCHQGYAPVTPGDPGHWYSNAARDPSKAELGKSSLRKSKPIESLLNILNLPAWLHPLQYIPREYYDPDVSEEEMVDRLDKIIVNEKTDESDEDDYMDGYICRHRDDITKAGDEKQWPAVVVLRKVIHQDADGVGAHVNSLSSVDWDQYDKSDPYSAGDLDHQENKAFIQEIRGYLDELAKEIKTHLDKSKDYIWQNDSEERTQHAQHSKMIGDIAQALQAQANTATPTHMIQHGNLATDLRNFQADYQTIRKILQEGATFVGTDRPFLDQTVNRQITKAKMACMDLDKLRRKRYRDLKAARAKADMQQVIIDADAGRLKRVREGLEQVASPRPRPRPSPRKQVVATVVLGEDVQEEGIQKKDAKKTEQQAKKTDGQSVEKVSSEESQKFQKEMKDFEKELREFKLRKAKFAVEEKELALKQRRLKSERKSFQEEIAKSKAGSKKSKPPRSPGKRGRRDDDDDEDDNGKPPPPKKPKPLPGISTPKPIKTTDAEKQKPPDKPGNKTVEKAGTKPKDKDTTEVPPKSASYPAKSPKKSSDTVDPGKKLNSKPGKKVIDKPDTEEDSGVAEVVPKPNPQTTPKPVKSPRKPTTVKANSSSKEITTIHVAPPKKPIFSPLPINIKKLNQTTAKPDPKTTTESAAQKPAKATGTKGPGRPPKATTKADKKPATSKATTVKDPPQPPPTRTSRRQQNQKVENEQVSDPEKEAKKKTKGKKGGK